MLDKNKKLIINVKNFYFVIFYVLYRLGMTTLAVQGAGTVTAIFKSRQSTELESMCLDHN